MVLYSKKNIYTENGIRAKEVGVVVYDEIFYAAYGAIFVAVYDGIFCAVYRGIFGGHVEGTYILEVIFYVLEKAMVHVIFYVVEQDILPRFHMEEYMIK